MAAVFLFLAAPGFSGTYILKLGQQPAASAMKEGEAAAAAVPPARPGRAQVLAEQNNVRNEIAQRTTAEVLDSIDTVENALIVRIDDEQADALAYVPGVVKVYPDKKYRLKLNRAVPLVHGTDAWFLIGGSDFAGAGIKIGIIDTGVDQTHPALQDPRLTVPEGFPKGNAAFTNSKVIVARSYTTATPVDDERHGTEVAGVAAASLTLSPLGLIAGVAPKAWIGNYKVFQNGGASLSSILKALDDAVKDGMDVVNLSLGSPLAMRSADSLEATSIANANAAGVVVVAAAGNEGPDPNTISDFGVSPDAIAVGATSNDRSISSSVTVEGAGPIQGTLSSGSEDRASISGPLFDVSQLDTTGRACAALPAGSMTGHIALILRGVCTFETKLTNAADAGAIAALIYTTPDQEVSGMDPGAASLPAMMIGNQSGLDVKSRLLQNPDLRATLDFQGQFAQPVDPNRLSSFSSVGPSVDVSIKPDLVAVGSFLYMPEAGMGYTTASGTSFSSPMVAGAAAVVKAARRGYSSGQYRSMLINSTSAFVPTAGPAGVQQTGAGILNVENAIVAPTLVAPTALTFGSGSGTFSMSRTLTVTNAGIAAGTFNVSVEPQGGGPAPVVSPNTLQLDPGKSQDVTVQFSGTGLASSAYQGVLIVHPSNGPDARVPYWYAVPSGVPERITILSSDESGRASSTRPVADAIIFRVTDSTGMPVLTKPDVSSITGTGRVSTWNLSGLYPGAWRVDVFLGVGINTFRIQAGAKQLDVSITGN